MPAHSPGLVVLVCGGALYLAACAPHSEAVARPVAAVAVGAAQRIVLDPAAALANRATEPAALMADEAVEVHLPDGTVGVRVAKRYYHTIRVCRQVDGSFSSNCPTVVGAP